MPAFQFLYFLSHSFTHMISLRLFVLLLPSLLPLCFLPLTFLLYFCHSVFKVLFSNTHSFYMFKSCSMDCSSHRSLHPWSAAVPQYHLSAQAIWLWDRAGLLGLWKWQGSSLHHSLFSLNLKRKINPAKTEITRLMALTSYTHTACVWLEKAKGIVFIFLSAYEKTRFLLVFHSSKPVAHNTLTSTDRPLDYTAWNFPKPQTALHNG